MSSRFPAVQVPAGLRTAEFVLRPIVADDAEKDHAAVMETREDLRLWEQSTWPEEDFVERRWRGGWTPGFSIHSVPGLQMSGRSSGWFSSRMSSSHIRWMSFVAPT
jgi:hypothetical protein